jgi:hypothetical protein
MNPVKIDLEDGVKAIFADGWIHLRVPTPREWFV